MREHRSPDSAGRRPVDNCQEPEQHEQNQQGMGNTTMNKGPAQCRWKQKINVRGHTRKTAENRAIEEYSPEGHADDTVGKNRNRHVCSRRVRNHHATGYGPTELHLTAGQRPAIRTL